MDYLKVTDSGLEVGSIYRQNKADGKERERGKEERGRRERGGNLVQRRLADLCKYTSSIYLFVTQASYVTSLSLLKIGRQCRADAAGIRFNYTFAFCVPEVLNTHSFNTIHSMGLK